MHYFISLAIVQQGNIWWVILVDISLFDDVPAIQKLLRLSITSTLILLTNLILP